LRKIAADAAHTVSTFAPQGEQIDSMIVLGNRLYLYERSSSETMIESIDLATAARTDVIRGGAEIFGFSSSDSLQNGGLATDGTDLFVYFKGLVFRVTLAGQVEHVAGFDGLRSTIEFEGDYDPSISHPALETQLPSRGQFATAGADSWLAVDADQDIYFIGSMLDPYVVRFECGR
jgi:hypothetical protein